ncbi:hypothetical protein B0H14DRAFT_2607113 [Mycena olivaceomarginata]|nr:hypothetical protein B0H14DRAFT_2607113 [Mycena olivaceomarginata]
MAVLMRCPPAASTGPKKVRRTPPDHHTQFKLPLPVLFVTSIQQQLVDVGRFPPLSGGSHGRFPPSSGGFHGRFPPSSGGFHGQIRWTMAEFVPDPPASAGVSTKAPLIQYHKTVYNAHSYSQAMQEYSNKHPLLFGIGYSAPSTTYPKWQLIKACEAAKRLVCRAKNEQRQ